MKPTFLARLCAHGTKRREWDSHEGRTTPFHCHFTRTPDCSTTRITTPASPPREPSRSMLHSTLPMAHTEPLAKLHPDSAPLGAGAPRYRPTRANSGSGPHRPARTSLGLPWPPFTRDAADHPAKRRSALTRRPDQAAADANHGQRPPRRRSGIHHDRHLQDRTAPRFGTDPASSNRWMALRKQRHPQLPRSDRPSGATTHDVTCPHQPPKTQHRSSCSRQLKRPNAPRSALRQPCRYHSPALRYRPRRRILSRQASPA